MCFPPEGGFRQAHVEKTLAGRPSYQKMSCQEVLPSGFTRSGVGHLTTVGRAELLGLPHPAGPLSARAERFPNLLIDWFL